MPQVKKESLKFTREELHVLNMALEGSINAVSGMVARNDLEQTEISRTRAILADSQRTVAGALA